MRIARRSYFRHLAEELKLDKTKQNGISNYQNRYFKSD
jgi:hypothetical protein